MPEFYAACQALLATMGKDLAYLFGDDVATAAQTMIGAMQESQADEVRVTLEGQRRTWEDLPDEEKATQREQARLWATRHEGHRVTCPACESPALLEGSPIGAPTSELADDMVVERQNMLPAGFECVACNLKIVGLARLAVTNFGDPFVATRTYYASELFEPQWEEDFNDI